MKTTIYLIFTSRDSTVCWISRSAPKKNEVSAIISSDTDANAMTRANSYAERNNLTIMNVR